MAQVAEKRLTFQEFEALQPDGRYELVDGRLEQLVSPSPKHGWTCIEFAAEIVPYLRAREPNSYRGAEVDIPTIPFFGRRPDFVYYSPEDHARLDLQEDRVLGVPTLVVEILSEDDRRRDLVTKRREYAAAGIKHYWILDPKRKTALTLVLRESKYEVAGEFSGDATLTSDLFPDLEIPLSRLFR
jgi:Uma2 family endonuclease